MVTPMVLRPMLPLAPPSELGEVWDFLAWGAGVGNVSFGPREGSQALRFWGLSVARSHAVFAPALVTEDRRS